MIKLIGAAFIITGTAIWGFLSVLKLRARVRSLSAIISALEIMKSEVCDRLTPMPEIFELMSSEATQPAERLFLNAQEKMSLLGSRSFSSIWQQSVKDTTELLLTQPEETVLCELGMSLGKYDVFEQKRAFEHASWRMKAFLKRAEDDRDAYSRVNAFMGVAAGVFAVIVLI